ncbi:MAG: hypothetical protein LBJ40_02855 [Delftia acidovorans]|nr:hypothetical protein [Delftia acidovorans]
MEVLIQGRWDGRTDTGLIREFEVMVRPMSGLQALGTEMGKRLGDKLPAFKAVA